MDASLLIKLILGSAAAVAAAPFDLAAAEAAETAGVHEQHIANLINGAADDANNHRRLQSGNLPGCYVRHRCYCNGPYTASSCGRAGGSWTTQCRCSPAVPAPPAPPRAPPSPPVPPRAPPAPPTPCLTEGTIASWHNTNGGTPLNEPCYSGENTCVGYMVCCVTAGTCVSQHGGLVSSNALYYEGGCYSNSSSRRSFAPGCQGMQGECNIPYLQAVRGVTSVPSVVTPVPQTTLARLAFEYVQDATPCVVWDVITMEVTFDGASMSSFTGRGGYTSRMCGMIATAAGLPSAYASCSAATVSAGVTLTASIQATGVGVTTRAVVSSLEAAFGTAALATATLTSSSYTPTISSAPVMTTFEAISPPTPPALPPAPPTQCIDSTAIASWGAPINEPCYSGENTCVGYPVCCVTAGTCVSQHGGMVSSNHRYYEGGCYSSSSSKRTTGPGCGGMQGECNIPYLQSAMGATSVPSVITTIPDATLARLAFEYVQDATPCKTWDEIEVAVTIAHAYISAFQGRRGQTSRLCRAIATAAGVPSAYVSCRAAALNAPEPSRRLAETFTSADDEEEAEAMEALKIKRRLQGTGSGNGSGGGTGTGGGGGTSGGGCYSTTSHTCDCSTTQAACTGIWTPQCGCSTAGAPPRAAPSPPPPGPGVVLVAVIQATGDNITTAGVQANLAATMGTPELATATLTSSSYAVTVTTAPLVVVYQHATAPSPPPAPITPPMELGGNVVGRQEAAAGGSLSTEAIIGIVIAILAVLGILVGAYFYFNKPAGGEKYITSTPVAMQVGGTSATTEMAESKI